MRQTAMLAFLEHPDMPIAYGYKVARNALKNYKWIHIRGLNGGWKSLKAKNYICLDMPLKSDDEKPRDNIHWLLLKSRPWEPPRPVEHVVEMHLDPAPNVTEIIFRDVLHILAGMSPKNWFPEQMYRAALILTLAGNGHTWEEIEDRTGLEYSDVYDIYWVYRKSRLNPYLKLSPMHQEIIRIRGQLRVAYFEEMSEKLLNNGIRKMVVFPHGIYTIMYQQRTGPRSGTVEGWLQNGRKINGRSTHRKVYLGHVGQMTKERLLAATHQLERKLAALTDIPRKCGIGESSKLIFAKG